MNEGMTMVVSTPDGGRLNLRKEPGVNKTILDRLDPGTEVSVIAEKGNWSEVDVHGFTGWVMTKYLAVPEHKAELRLVLTDSEGNQFVPVGDVTISLKYLDD